MSPIPDGAADWMGRDAWFAENNHPNDEAQRQLFDAVRDSLNATRGLLATAAVDTAAASALLDHAWRTFLAHQYEFGVLGSSGNTNGADWQLVRQALVGARAARHALGGVPAAYIADVNDDVEDEVVLANATDMIALPPRGGRLLYWFDLERGLELVGNENFMYYGEDYVTDSRWQSAVPASIPGSRVIRSSPKSSPGSSR